MAERHQTVEDRYLALQPIPPTANFTIAAARKAYGGIGGEEVHCTIAEYCRTRIFEFPRAYLNNSDRTTHRTIYTSESIQATLVEDILDYFTKSTVSKHYTTSPSIRYGAAETKQESTRQHGERRPLFIIIEESSSLTETRMNSGECSKSDQVITRDETDVPLLTGGQKGEQFIIAWHTLDGAWPELPNNEEKINMILAAIRAAQETAHPIRKLLDEKGLITNDGEFVEMVRMTMSAARGTTIQNIDASGVERKAEELTTAIAAMEKDLGIHHLALLFNSMYSDEERDSAYEQLAYLQLWQSLCEAGPRHLACPDDVRTGPTIVAGEKSLLELRQHRDDIAHWRTTAINLRTFYSLRQTVNELVRRKYF